MKFSRLQSDDMENIPLRWMENHEINKLADLDRSESVKTSYRLEAGDLVAKPIDWNVPSFFPEGEGDHSLVA
jgi:hypothetical protein